MADQITYGDKSQGQVSGFPTNQKWNFGDANEVKSVVNTNALETDQNTSDLSSVIPRLDNIEAIIAVDVASLSDLPTPVSGVITLDVASTIYKIRGNVDIGANRIVIAATAVEIAGSFGSIDFISSTTTDALITATNFNVFIRDVRLTALSASKLFDLVGSGTESAQIKMCAGIATNLGTCDDYKTFGIRDSFFTAFNTGFVLNGVFDAILFKINIAESFTGVFIDLNGCTCDAIDISENAITLQTGGTFLEIAPNGANIISGGEGTIFGNKINIIAGGTPIVGYDTFEQEWGVGLNDKIKTSDRALPTGWGFYVDGETSPSTQTFTSTAALLQIDGLNAVSDENHLPNSIRGISSLWDTTNDVIIPITEGDSMQVRVDLEVTGDTGNPSYIQLRADIGGGVSPTINIIDKILPAPKTPPFNLSVDFSIFAGVVFVANNAQIFLNTDVGTVTVASRGILITRTSSGAT